MFPLFTTFLFHFHVILCRTARRCGEEDEKRYNVCGMCHSSNISISCHHIERGLLDGNCFPDACCCATHHMFCPAQTEHDMFSPLQPRLICWQVVSYTLHALVNFTAFFTEHRHEGEERSSPRMEAEGATGGWVCAAAPDLDRFAVPAGSPEGADGGAAQVGRPDAGAVTELHAAGGGAAHGPCRRWRGEESPAQQKRPGASSSSRERRWEGHDDADDILLGSSKIPNDVNAADCLLCFSHLLKSKERREHLFVYWMFSIVWGV